VVATTALAALIARRDTDAGAHIESSQAESIIVALGPRYLRASLSKETGEALAPEADTPSGVYPCAGDDEWCVVTVRDDADWSALVEALGSPGWAIEPALATRDGRAAARRAIDRHLAAWTAVRAPREVADLLQKAGVPAGLMERVADELDDPQLAARHFFRSLAQPGMDTDVIVEPGPCRAERMPDPELRPAPFYGQHTRDVCRELLGMTDEDVDALVERGVLDEAAEQDLALLLPPA
jgi:crotonobetainyl-CoA:carnitine CoA-transferase CaiB-like acyl-CoA transferase